MNKYFDPTILKNLRTSKEYTDGVYLEYFDNKGFKLSGSESICVNPNFYDFTKLMYFSSYPKRGDYCCDGSCIGNGKPDGHGKFNIIDTTDYNSLFMSKDIIGVTNNITEFIGLIAAIDLADESGSPKNIYCDSIIAINWLFKKQIKTNGLSYLVKNEDVLSAFEYAMWNMKECKHLNHRIYWWITKSFGENPADLDGKTNKIYFDEQMSYLESKTNDNR